MQLLNEGSFITKNIMKLRFMTFHHSYLRRRTFLKKNMILWSLLIILSLNINLTYISPVKADVGDPYFYSLDYITYDSDNDGLDDGVKANFDPDFPDGYSGTITVHVGLYASSGTLINDTTGTYFLDGDDYDYLELNLGNLSTTGLYYLSGEIFFESALTDASTTDTFRLGLLPYLYSFDYSTYDSDNDGADDGVKAVFDPDFPSGYSGTATIHASLYTLNGTLVSNTSSNYFLDGDDYDYLELDLGTVNTTGLYYLFGEIFFESTLADMASTPTFRLGLEPYFYSFDYLTYDSDNDGLDDGVKAVFDPDVPSGYSGKISVFIDLYSSNRTLITTVSEVYLVYGESVDYFEQNLGTVSTAGFYYLLGEISFRSISTDTITTSTFYLNPVSTTINDKPAITNVSIVPYKHKTGYKRGQNTKSVPSTDKITGFESISVLAGIFCLTVIIWQRQRKKRIIPRLQSR